jgi:L-lysine 2,3-aminomutase
MAHFNHPVELQTEIVKTAISRIRSMGAQIRTQSPVLNHINNDPDLWAEMWRKQVNLNCIPYYMFVERDTGAQHFFALPLVKAWEIFREAYQKVSGVCRTVRGPSMSAGPGKIQILGVSEIQNEKVFVLRFIQGRNPDWVAKPFFAKYNENAIWWNDLQPAFNEENFFFEKELAEYSNEQLIAMN